MWGQSDTAQPHGVAAVPTSESLVAWCDGEGALLHSQLVELGELWRDSSRGRLWEWEGRQGEKQRKRENIGRGKSRTNTSQSIQTAVQRNRTKTNKSHITQFCCVYFSYPFIKLYIDYHWLSISVFFCLCGVPHRYSSKVQAASLGNAFSQSSGRGKVTMHKTECSKYSY